ncbi:cystathionine beta-lyase [Humibacillus sp. DSM 29435]|uniref:MalY/PatB family protein n=1 Tax=Humibacillus sp. DSM 29435 TaxID=1869167 RepID=UPI00087315C8|nr:aminotransferase class I/II-fold pyridoxal phosphate-dependent enzyme [Humibacillus sp. DSM 29435]OFE17487.1 cystathionine beta-lyase [Humibacillus sp. DSM 29435]
MGQRIFDVSLDELRRSRTSVKWRAHAPDVLPLFIAEMDAAPCPAVVDAVTSAVARGDTGYAWSLPYASACASFADVEWGWSFDPGRTTSVADVLTGVVHLIGLFTEPGGPVVISSPVYNAFFDVIASTGRRVVDAPLGANGELDLEALERVFGELQTERARAVYLLSNPHNPTGTVHSLALLGGLATLADEYGVQVISDEIHGPLVYDEVVFTPYLTVPGSERGITVTSASKAWNLAGLKAAVIVPGPDAVADVGRLHPLVTYGASHLGVIAQTAAYTRGREWVHRLMGELGDNRALLGELVATRLPGVGFVAPPSTYLAWLDFRRVGLGDDPAAVLLERGRVALSPGPTFGRSGAGFARLNFATSPEILGVAVDRIAACLD